MSEKLVEGPRHRPGAVQRRRRRTCSAASASPAPTRYGNMFQVYRDFEKQLLAKRSLATAKKLNPQLQNFTSGWRRTRTRFPSRRGNPDQEPRTKDQGPSGAGGSHDSPALSLLALQFKHPTAGKQHASTHSKPNRPVQVIAPFSRPTPLGHPLIAMALALAAALGATACNGSGEARSEAEAPPGQGRGGRGGDAAAIPVVTATAITKWYCHGNRGRHCGIHLHGSGALPGDGPAREGALRRRGRGQGRPAPVHPRPPAVSGRTRPGECGIGARHGTGRQCPGAGVARLKNLLDRGLIRRERYETLVATAAALKATTDAAIAPRWRRRS